MFVDTSGLLCLIDDRQGHHLAAVAHYDAAARRFTHSGVLLEFVALAHARRFPRQRTLDFVGALLHEPGVEIVWADEGLHRQGLGLLHARPDKHYSLCDAMSFTLMRALGVFEALSTDHH